MLIGTPSCGHESLVWAHCLHTVPHWHHHSELTQRRSSPFRILSASCKDSISSRRRSVRSLKLTPASMHVGLSLSKYSSEAVSSFCVPSTSFFFAVRANSSSCFFCDLFVTSLVLLALSVLESAMNDSYSFCAVVSAESVSDSKRAKSDSMTSSMLTTPPLSPPMPLYAESQIGGGSWPTRPCTNAVASAALA